MLPHWMFNCEAVSRKVSESMDRRLSITQRMMIRFHMAMCRHCARFRSQLIKIRELCRLTGPEDEDLAVLPPLSPHARERIVQALKSADSGP
ncbi:MAG: zf-HC2 domain-containing protein [Desulfobacterales bacterium]|jgi:hypothetical protein